MKKLFSLAVSALFAISLSSCATTPTDEAEAEGTPAEVAQVEETPAEVTPAEDAEKKARSGALRGPRRVIHASNVPPNVYTECGIGALFFNNKYWNLWPLASTGNIVWDLGLTGTSSATASPQTCTGVKVETAKLILETLPGLEKDIALGRGKHLTALHETMGCDITRQEEINSSLRVSYANVVNDESYEKNSDLQRSSDLYDTVRAVTSSFNGSCVAL